MNSWGHQSKFKLKLSDGLDHPINMNLGYTLPNMASNISIVWIGITTSNITYSAQEGSEKSVKGITVLLGFMHRLLSNRNKELIDLQSCKLPCLKSNVL